MYVELEIALRSIATAYRSVTTDPAALRHEVIVRTVSPEVTGPDVPEGFENPSIGHYLPIMSSNSRLSNVLFRLLILNQLAMSLSTQS